MAAPTTGPAVIDRGVALEWYRRNRDRSRRLFDLLQDSAYYAQPISLRHPIVFYEGHLPACPQAIMTPGWPPPWAIPRDENGGGALFGYPQGCAAFSLGSVITDSPPADCAT